MAGTGQGVAGLGHSVTGLGHGSGRGHHQHHLLSYKPIKFESEEQLQQHYSVHEDQDHHQYPNQLAVHAVSATLYVFSILIHLRLTATLVRFRP